MPSSAVRCLEDVVPVVVMRHETGRGSHILPHTSFSAATPIQQGLSLTALAVDCKVNMHQVEGLLWRLVPALT